VESFKPYAVNYARVLAFNGAWNGPPSNTIRFQTPEGKPGPVDMIECFPMGSSALLLSWRPPEEVNGLLTGYRIYYQEVIGTKLGPLLEREPRIMKSRRRELPRLPSPSAAPTTSAAAAAARRLLERTEKAKLAGLRSHSKYRIIVRATTAQGEGMMNYVECNTNPQSNQPPSRPRFK